MFTGYSSRIKDWFNLCTGSMDLDSSLFKLFLYSLITYSVLFGANPFELCFFKECYGDGDLDVFI